MSTIEAMDVTEATFQTAVIERSRELPVLVDFWAQWCGPCRALGPILERAVEGRGGQVELVKVDTDSNQQLARDYRIQGIPAVKAFRDGAVVAEFVGAQPAAAVERFLDGLVPSEADSLIEQGDEPSLRRALELDPTRAEAAVALARLILARGETEEALELLRNVPGSFATDGLAARIELESSESPAPPEVRQAFSALDAGDLAGGLDLLISALPGADGAREGIRRVVVGLLDELGVEHPLARESRRRLASALY